MSSKNWCYTWNNYTDKDYKDITSYNCEYQICAKEVGESGTPHLQGYIEFKSTKLFDTLKNNFPKVHWEIRKGTQDQAITYCKKDNNFIELGTKKSQGKRNDLIAVANAVVDKSFTPTDFPEEYIKYHKGIEAFKASLLIDRTEKPIVIWRWGMSGVGKTYEAIQKHKHSFYIKDGTQWWDGYTQQEAIIIDDFDGKWPFRDLLRLLDQYPYQGQYKGGYVKVNSPYIYITCEFPPSHFWSDNTLQQVVRRCTEIIHVVPNFPFASEVASEVAGNTIPPPKESINKCLL